MTIPRVGIDHKIRIEDMDLVYHQWVTGVPIKAETMVPQWTHVRGLASRRKAATIMTRLWNHPQWCGDREQALLNTTLNVQRMLGYWGLFMVAYPFFADAATLIGRLLTIQAEFTTRHIQVGMAAKYGDSERTRVGVKMVLGALVDWGIIDRMRVGHYRRMAPIVIDVPITLQFITYVSLAISDSPRIVLEDVARAYWLFPFQVHLSRHAIADSSLFSLEQSGNRHLIVGLSANAIC